MQKFRHVQVLYTGGTIGMVPTDEGWAPGADLAGWLAELVATRLPGLSYDLACFEEPIDSASATPDDWQRILDVVRDDEVHDAHVVLHGTDTMAFSAAATAYALAGTGRPVVFTGAQHSLVEAGGDARRNVLGALHSALDERLEQVAVFFDDRLFAAHRVSKISSLDDHAFESMDAAPIAQMVGDDLVFAPGDHGELPALPQPLKPVHGVDLVVLSLYPGLAPHRLAAQLTPAPRAVVLRAYGSGNGPQDEAIARVLRGATEAGAVLVVTTQCAHGGVDLGRYAASSALVSAGGISGGTLPTESLVALLTVALSQGFDADEVRDLVARVVG